MGAQRSVSGGARPAAAVASGASTRRATGVAAATAKIAMGRARRARPQRLDDGGRRPERERDHAARGNAHREQLEPPAAERSGIADRARQQRLAGAHGGDPGGADQPALQHPLLAHEQPRDAEREHEREEHDQDHTGNAERALARGLQAALAAPRARERDARLVGEHREQRDEHGTARRSVSGRRRTAVTSEHRHLNATLNP